MNDNSPFSFQVPDTLSETELQTAAFAASLWISEIENLPTPPHLAIPAAAMLFACMLVPYCAKNEPDRDPLDKAMKMMEQMIAKARANSPRTELPIPHVPNSTEPLE